MTPLTNSSSPGVVKSMSRYARRFSSVDSSLIVSNRFSIVPELSSAARIPLSSATSAFAISCRPLAAIAFSFHQLSDLLGRVVGGDSPHGAGAGAHHDRLGLDAGAADADAAQEDAARDAGRGDEDILARDQIVGREHAVDVVAGVDELLALHVVAWPQLALNGAAQALDRRGGDNALWGAPDPHQHVHAGERLRCCDRRGDVAVPDQVDACPGLAQLPDQLLVAIALEDDDGHLADVEALCLRDRTDVLGRARVDVDR